jgi:hypothetical protein
MHAHQVNVGEEYASVKPQCVVRLYVSWSDESGNVSTQMEATISNLYE